MRHIDKFIIKRNKKEVYIIPNSKVINFEVKMANYNIKSFVDIEESEDILRYKLCEKYKSLKEVAMKKKLDRKLLIKVLKTIATINLENYLLRKESMLLDINYIYVDSKKGDIKFIYVPFNTKNKNFEESFKDFVSNLIYGYIDNMALESKLVKGLIENINNEKIESLIEYINSIEVKRDFKKNVLEKAKLIFSGVDEKCFETELITIDKSIMLSIKGKIKNYTKFPLIIGKNSKYCNILINDNAVSRIHAQIEKEEEKIYIKDLNSKNGTYLNGKKIARMKRRIIKSGDYIRVGKEEIKIAI